MAESTTPAQCTQAEYNMALVAGLISTEPGTNAFDAAVHRFADAVRKAAAAPELLAELQLAHLIIRNALNIMTPQQKAEWARVNERDDCIGEGTTRANERAAVILKATEVQS